MVADQGVLMAQGGQLDGGQFLNELSLSNPKLARLIQDVIDGVNRTATNAGVSATGEVSPPKAPDAVTVKVAGEMMHVSISHSGPVERGVQYFTEIHTSPSFGQPIVSHPGTSRTPPPFPLPTYPDGGGSKTNYYVRAYVQNPGGPPSPVTVAGGVGSPTAFNMNGSTQMTLLASHGSGTAPNTGQSAGQGLGKFQKRSS